MRNKFGRRRLRRLARPAITAMYRYIRAAMRNSTAICAPEIQWAPDCGTTRARSARATQPERPGKVCTSVTGEVRAGAARAITTASLTRGHTVIALAMAVETSNAPAKPDQWKITRRCG